MKELVFQGQFTAFPSWLRKQVEEAALKELVQVAAVMVVDDPKIWLPGVINSPLVRFSFAFRRLSPTLMRAGRFDPFYPFPEDCWGSVFIADVYDWGKRIATIAARSAFEHFPP